MRLRLAISLCAALSALGLRGAPETTEADRVLAQITAAVASVDALMPEITATAEEAAARIWRNPNASIECPRQGQWGFSEEFWERAGGLAQFADGSFDVSANVILLSSRVAAPTNAGGKLVVRFPPATDDRGINLVADVVAGWAWCCEYAAAMTRTCGRFPAITKTLGADDSWIVNCGGWSPDHLPRLLPCAEKIPAGKLGRQYVAKALAMLHAMTNAPTRDAVATAARCIGAELAAGRTVGVAGLGHPIIEECTCGLKSAMKGICAVGNIPQAYSEALKPGDVLVWIAYHGLDTHWADYGTPMRKAGLKLVLSHSAEATPASGDWIKAFIPQLWNMPDAEVPIPVRPFAMGPLSEVSRCTILRMLDAEVAVAHPRGANPSPSWGTAFFEKMEYAKKTPPPDIARRSWTHHGFTFVMDANHMWSLKDRTPFAYDMLRPLSPKLIAYERDRRFGLMSPEGKELTSAKWELVAPYGLFGMPETDFAVYAQDGRYGKMNPLTGAVHAEPPTPKYP